MTTTDCLQSCAKRADGKICSECIAAEVARRVAEKDAARPTPPSYTQLRADLQEAVALLQTLMDVAAEGAGPRQSYDFRARAELASDKARAFLGRAK